MTELLKHRHDSSDVFVYILEISENLWIDMVGCGTGTATTATNIPVNTDSTNAFSTDSTNAFSMDSTNGIGPPSSHIDIAEMTKQIEIKVIECISKCSTKNVKCLVKIESVRLISSDDRNVLALRVTSPFALPIFIQHDNTIIYAKDIEYIRKYNNSINKLNCLAPVICMKEIHSYTSVRDTRIGDIVAANINISTNVYETEVQGNVVFHRFHQILCRDVITFLKRNLGVYDLNILFYNIIMFNESDNLILGILLSTDRDDQQNYSDIFRTAFEVFNLRESEYANVCFKSTIEAVLTSWLSQSLQMDTFVLRSLVNWSDYKYTIVENAFVSSKCGKSIVIFYDFSMYCSASNVTVPSESESEITKLIRKHGCNGVKPRFEYLYDPLDYLRIEIDGKGSKVNVTRSTERNSVLFGSLCVRTFKVKNMTSKIEIHTSRELILDRHFSTLNTLQRNLTRNVIMLQRISNTLEYVVHSGSLNEKRHVANLNCWHQHSLQSGANVAGRKIKRCYKKRKSPAWLSASCSSTANATAHAQPPPVIEIQSSLIEGQSSSPEPVDLSLK